MLVDLVKDNEYCPNKCLLCDFPIATDGVGSMEDKIILISFHLLSFLYVGRSIVLRPIPGLRFGSREFDRLVIDDLLRMSPQWRPLCPLSSPWILL